MNWYVHITVFFAHVYRFGCVSMCVWQLSVCVCVCYTGVLSFVSAYLSLDLRIHSVTQTELKHTYTHMSTHTHGYNSTHTPLNYMDLSEV